jgi:NAD(P)-dependent dehydrogenase (short-subunit alcohol dehydrogenase family)
MDLTNVTALITGGSSGLGAATARLFRARGAKVVIADRAEPRDKDHGATFVQTDVTNEDQVRAAIAAAGPLHVVVGCAGVGNAGRVLGKEGVLPLDAFAKVVQVNLIGMFNVTRLAAEAMQKNEPNAGGERGVIIHTASIAAYDGQIGQAAYAASKAGVVGMTLPIARELARVGIRVMTIAPGIFDTPMLAGLPEAARQSLGAQVPFPSRLGDPSEYAALAAHIVENAMLNGEVIRLDGALRMAPR